MMRLCVLLAVVMLFYYPVYGDQKGYVATFNISPDGRQLVFSANGRGYSDLYLLNLGTLAVVQLTNTSLYEINPTFSPDGKWIAYAAGSKNSNGDQIFIRSLDGKQVKQLTSDQNVSNGAPTFSPDGSSIVFSRQSQYQALGSMGRWGKGDLYLIKKDGTKLQRLTRENYNNGVIPNFSSDGKMIVYAAEKNIVTNIFLLNLSGGRPKQLTHHKQLDAGSAGPNSSEPSFALNRKDILFTSDREGLYAYNLYLMDAKGKRIRRLAIGNLTISNPRFLLNGKHILFLNQPDAAIHQYGLWQIDKNGKNKYRIADSSLFDNPLKWKSAEKPAATR